MQLDGKEINKTPGADKQLIRISEQFTTVPLQIMAEFIQKWPRMITNRNQKRATLVAQIRLNDQISISQAEDLARIAIPITGNANPSKVKEILDSTQTDNEWKKYLIKWW